MAFMAIHNFSTPSFLRGSQVGENLRGLLFHDVPYFAGHGLHFRQRPLAGAQLDDVPYLSEIPRANDLGLPGIGKDISGQLRFNPLFE